MEDCIFCKIVAEKIHGEKLYETPNILAFLDIAPANYGHTLIIPKRHYETLFDIPDETLKEIATELKHIGKAVIDATGAEGVNIVMNNKKAAGQIVPHAHFHIIPRYVSDGHKFFGNNKKYPDGEMTKVAQKIKKGLV